MNTALLVFVIILGIGSLMLIAFALGLPVIGGRQSVRSSMHGHLKNIVEAQRTVSPSAIKDNKQTYSSIFKTAEKEGPLAQQSHARLTLRKKLKYARWPISPAVYYLCAIVISLMCLFVFSTVFGIIFQVLSLFVGFIFMGWLLNSAVHRRFKAFDKDYPPFLLSLVGLLKTGMNTMTALAAAAEGLEEGSLVKEEVELMLERLRMGIPEEQAIGSFGEDIYHEEIELFVQALILSRRVGGNLSDTLDRLARQVRKRQYFRESAYAAVGQQRTSIWVIIGVLSFILGYMLVATPDIILAAYNDPIGWQIYQGSLLLIILGIFWIRHVTKIRV